MSVFDKIFDFNFENDTGLFNLTSGFFVGYVNKLFSTKNRAILIVCPSIYEARKIYNKFIDTRDVIIFENDDLYFSNDSIVSPELMVDRLNILNDLLVDSKKIVITDVSGYLKILPNVNNFNDYVIKISRDNIFSLNDLVSKLVDIGYSRETMVSKMGEFALRGFVLDIFPINNDNPIRISFFGDDVEAIKTFDLDSQRSINEIDSFTLLPNKEIISDNISSIFDYLNNPIVVYKDYEQIKFTYEKMIQDVFYYGNDKKYFLDINDVKVSDKLFYFDIDNLSLIDIKKSYDFGVSQVPLFNENFLDINNFVNKSILKKKTVIIFVSISNVNYFLDKLDFPFVITDINNIYDNKVNIIKGKFSEGFETRDYVILTDYELFNKKNVATKRTRFKNSSRIKDLSKISVGDYQYGLTLPVDDETKIMKRDKRFPIDIDGVEPPDIYKLTNRKVLLTDDRSFGSGGILVWTLSFTEFNVDTDKKIKLDNGSEVWICDYKEPTPLPPEPDETTDSSAVISGKSNLINGFSRTYSVEFRDSNGDIKQDVDFTWNVESDFDVQQTINGNQIELSVDDETLIGSSFVLQALVQDKVLSEFEITITSLY